MKLCILTHIGQVAYFNNYDLFLTRRQTVIRLENLNQSFDLQACSIQVNVIVIFLKVYYSCIKCSPGHLAIWYTQSRVHICTQARHRHMYTHTHARTVSVCGGSGL